MTNKKGKLIENRWSPLRRLNAEKAIQKRSTLTIREPRVIVSTLPAQIGTSASAAGGSRAAASEKETDDFAGFIFTCNARTKREFYQYRVFGLPIGCKKLVERIKNGQKLFLFDYDLSLLYGVYEATSNGGLNLEPNAFSGEFPAQVRFNIDKNCLPLPEKYLRKLIQEKSAKFRRELNSQQVDSLVSSFRPSVESSPSPAHMSRTFPSEPVTLTSVPGLPGMVNKYQPFKKFTQEDWNKAGASQSHMSRVLEAERVSQMVQNPQHDFSGPISNTGNAHPTMHPRRAHPALKGPYHSSNVQKPYSFTSAAPHLRNQNHRRRNVQEMVPPDQYIGLGNKFGQLPFQMGRAEASKEVNAAEHYNYNGVLSGPHAQLSAQSNALSAGGPGMLRGNASVAVWEKLPSHRDTGLGNKYSQLLTQAERAFLETENPSTSQARLPVQSNTSSGGPQMSWAIPIDWSTVFGKEYSQSLRQTQMSNVPETKNPVESHNHSEIPSDPHALLPVQSNTSSGGPEMSWDNALVDLQRMVSDNWSTVFGKEYSQSSIQTQMSVTPETENHSKIPPGPHALPPVQPNTSSGRPAMSSGNSSMDVQQMVSNDWTAIFGKEYSQSPVHMQMPNFAVTENPVESCNQSDISLSPHALPPVHSNISSEGPEMTTGNAPIEVQPMVPHDQNTGSREENCLLSMQTEIPIISERENAVECNNPSEIPPMPHALLPAQSNTSSVAPEGDAPVDLKPMVPFGQSAGFWEEYHRLPMFTEMEKAFEYFNRNEILLSPHAMLPTQSTMLSGGLELSQGNAPTDAQPKAPCDGNTGGSCEDLDQFSSPIEIIPEMEKALEFPSSPNAPLPEQSNPSLRGPDMSRDNAPAHDTGIGEEYYQLPTLTELPTVLPGENAYQLDTLSDGENWMSAGNVPTSILDMNVLDQNANFGDEFFQFPM